MNRDINESNELDIWGFKIPTRYLSKEEINYLQGLPPDTPNVQWLCDELNRVWSSLGLNNRKDLSGQRIGDFYSHPVWIVNGIFTSVDPESSSHREAISIAISKLKAKRIADYGGGFGELALKIAKTCPHSEIDVIEPFPSKFGTYRISSTPAITMRAELQREYDCVVAQDILEHVEDPISLAYDICKYLHVGAIGIFANCFFPVIDCHLPRTFYLRHTFKYVMQAMGMIYIGTVEGTPHAHMFTRVGELNKKSAFRANAIAKIIGPLISFAVHIKSKRLRREIKIK